MSAVEEVVPQFNGGSGSAGMPSLTRGTVYSAVQAFTPISQAFDRLPSFQRTKET